MSARRRPDIQGMRALAVLSVVAFHLRPTWFPGGFAGVDVFFVLSGYLITTGLLREAGTGRIALAAFWGRRIRRLMPAATVVIVATLATTVLLMPVALRPAYVRQAAAATLSVENWLLAADSVNYLHATALPSPFQHFWSLGVEEQFYLFWPLIAAAVAAICGRRRRSPGRTLGLVAGGLAVSSLVWSITSTSTQPGIAYFSTLTRAWELLLGAALAIWLPTHALPPRAARPVFAAGAALVVASVALLDSATPFPGWAALMPTLGTVGMLAAGATAFTSPLRSLAEWRPVTYIGDISYSLYLWHWPLIIGVCAAMGTLTVPREAVVPVLAGSVLLAAASKRYVEDPFQAARKAHHVGTASPRRALRSPFTLGAALLACSAMGITAVHALPVPPPPPSGPVDAYVGARIEDPDFDPTAIADLKVPPSPTLMDLQAIEPQLREPCLAQAASRELTTCEFGDPDGTSTLLIAGDSHATMWLPPLDQLGRQHGWKVVVAGKQSCPLVWLEQGEDADGPYYGECREWNQQLRSYATQLQPDAVLTSAAFYSYPDGASTGDASYDAASGTAYARQYEFLQDTGAAMVAIREIPHFPGFSAPDCLAMAGATAEDCSARMTLARTPRPSRVELAAQVDEDASLIDLDGYICPDQCSAVVGNVVTYRDDNHLTPAFAESLAWVLDDELRRLVPALYPAQEQ